MDDVVQGYRRIAECGIGKGWDCARITDYCKSVPGYADDDPIFEMQFPIVCRIVACEIEISKREAEKKETDTRRTSPT